MSEVNTLITSFESKIKMLEQSIAQASSQVEQWSKNHAGLTGMLQATKEALAEAQRVMDVVAPESPVTEALNVAENVANVAVNVVDNIESADSAPSAP